MILERLVGLLPGSCARCGARVWLRLSPFVWLDLDGRKHVCRKGKR